jgi:scytalone dehydratase
VHTQHFLGSSLFTHISKTKAKGDWQVRARHVREVNGEERQWDSSAYVEFTYELINENWKISGLRPHTVVATTGRPEEVIGLFP